MCEVFERRTATIEGSKKMMKYKHLKGYKYMLMHRVTIHTDCDISCSICAKLPGKEFNIQVVTVVDNWMYIYPGYCWDGLSGPTIDSKNSMRGSLVHDVYYQLIREGKLDIKWRKYADQELLRICREDGMNSIRAGIHYNALRMFGAGACKPEKNPRGKIVEI